MIRYALVFALLCSLPAFGQQAERVGRDSAQDVVKIGSSVVLEEGRTAGDVVSVGGSVTVNGKATGDVVAVGGSVKLGPAASVSGDVVAIGGRIEKAPGASATGDAVEVNLPGLSDLAQPGSWLKLAGLFAFIGATVAFLWFLGMLALALLFVALVPGVFGAVRREAEQRPVACGLWGLLGVLLVVPVGLFLLVSIIGIPLIPIELMFVGCVAFTGYVGVGLCLGRFLARRSGKPVVNDVLAALLGLVIIWVVGMIPVVGWVVKAGAGLVGFGAAMLALQAVLHRRREAA